MEILSGAINDVPFSLNYYNEYSEDNDGNLALFFYILILSPHLLFCKRQTMNLTLNETPLFYERRGFLHSSGSSDDQGIRSSNSAGSIFPCLSQRFGSSVRIYLK